ncbi:unnamed protein product, partial [Effrenium voratum]
AGRCSAPPLQPPLRLGSEASNESTTEASEATPVELRSLHVVPAPSVTQDRCTCTAPRVLESFWSFLQPLEVCRGKNLPDLASGGPEMEVAEDGVVTYEWKFVVDRDRPFCAAAAAPADEMGLVAFASGLIRNRDVRTPNFSEWMEVSDKATVLVNRGVRGSALVWVLDALGEADLHPTESGRSYRSSMPFAGLKLLQVFRNRGAGQVPLGA